jgi:hypothetical protein
MAMQKFLGLLLLMSGLAMAAIWFPARDGNRRLAQVIEITENGIARVNEPNGAAAALRKDRETPDPSSTVPAASLAPQGGDQLASAAVQPTSSLRTSRMPPVGTAGGPGTQPSFTSQMAVTSASAKSAPEPHPRLGSAAPSTEEAHYALVRNLQRELRRLGCYWGEVDGDWGPGSKRAMSMLMERVNASLPINEPDYILLAMAQSQPDQACRRPCPTDQVYVSDSGQCQARALLTQAARNQAEGRSVAAPGENMPTGTPYTALPGQMAVGGQGADSASSGQPGYDVSQRMALGSQDAGSGPPNAASTGYASANPSAQRQGSYAPWVRSAPPRRSNWAKNFFDSLNSR